MSRKATSALHALPISLLLFSCGGGNNNDGVCGDGTVDAGEECDDANTTAGDGCEADCSLPVIHDVAVGNAPVAVSTVAINADNFEDIVVVNSGDNNVGILLGNGDGTFQPQVTFDVGVGPNAIAIGDFNGDSKEDLAVANFDGGAGNTVSILLGNGDGTFLPQTTVTVGNGPFGIARSNLNIFSAADAGDDLVVTNFSDATISLLFGNGDGTFQPQTTLAVGNFPAGVTVGFNVNFTTDIIVANSGDDIVTILTGSGDGNFQPGGGFGTNTGDQPAGVVFGDFGNGGVAGADIAVTNELGNSVTIFMGTGDGNFFPFQTPFPAGNFPLGIAGVDINRDFNEDIVVANVSDNSVSVLLSHGFDNATGQFLIDAPINTAVGAAPSAISFDDFNVDDTFDLVTANKDSNSVSILLGNGDGTFTR